MLQQEQIQQVNKPNKPKHIILNASALGTIYTVPRGKRFRGIFYIPSNGVIEISINGAKSGRLGNGDLTNIFSNSQLELYEGDTFAVAYMSHSAGLIGVEYDA